MHSGSVLPDMQPTAPPASTVTSLPSNSLSRSSTSFWVAAWKGSSTVKRLLALHATISPLAGLPVQPVEPMWMLKVLAEAAGAGRTTPPAGFTSTFRNLRPLCQDQAMAWISIGAEAAA